MAGSFVGSVQQYLANIAPWFLRNENVGRFLEAYALTLDSGLEGLRQGMKLSRPLQCDTSALPVLSRDRGIQLYPSEPEVSQRYRLSRWWQLHRQRGTHQGEMRHVQPYFLSGTMPAMRIIHQDGAGTSATWHSLDAEGVYSVYRAKPSNWNYDGQTSQWSRFWFLLYAPPGFLTGQIWDDGSTYDDGSCWDGLVSSQVALDLVSMVRDWKSAHSRLEAFIVCTDPTKFDPTSTSTTDPTGWTSLPIGNWGQPLSGGVHTRPPFAHWLYTAT